jgi:hypothetical protein
VSSPTAFGVGGGGGGDNAAGTNGVGGVLIIVELLS